MRSFLFESIWLLSRQDGRARQVSFHKNKNLIWGRNHTGKSSLLKSLYLTFGAKPQGELGQWDNQTVSLVDFRINGRKLRVLHSAGVRALFNEGGELITVATDHAEWSAAFASVTGFNLVLMDKSGKSVPADPKCFFLPFYINQDGSWQSTWTTFTGLQQFNKPVASILEYFTGIKPPEYYEAKAGRDAEQRLLEDLKREYSFLVKARERFGKKLSFFGPKITSENFNDEIKRLTEEVTQLNSTQEVLRSKCVSEKELLSNINLQIHLATAALRTYEGDTQYLRTEQREALVCPVCNAEHSESFMDLLTYADDARSLRDITVRLEGDAKGINIKLQKTLAEIGALEKQYYQISELLNIRRGDLQFREVIESLGAEQAFQAFEEEQASLDGEIAGHAGKVEIFNSVMSSLTDRKRSAQILKQYRESYSVALFDLNLPPSEKTKPLLTSRPNISGSGGPRSILAYYSAIWDACYGQNGAFTVPLVIDSPNQQGQDAINLPKVIKFVSEKLPEDAQMILGSEIDSDYPFDKKIELYEPYSLLSSLFFADVDNELTPLENSMFLAAMNKEKE